MSIIAELEATAKQATAERVASEMAERQRLFSLEQAKAEAAQRARHRAELAGILAEAESDQAAEMDRLGKSRLALAGLEREAERLADLAAAGDQNAPKAVVRLNDTLELNRSMVVAHGRRVAAATTVVDEATAALAAHDADATVATQRAREILLEQTAQLVDRRLEEAAAAAEQFVAILAAVRAARTPTAWSLSWAANQPVTHFLHNAHRAAGRLEPGFTTAGGGGRFYWPFARFAADSITNWKAARGEVGTEPAPTPAPPPAEAA